MEKVKKVAKYVVNGLNMINMLLLGLSKIWGWDIANISATIVVIAGVISLYLVGGKLFETDIIVDSDRYEQQKGVNYDKKVPSNISISWCDV